MKRLVIAIFTMLIGITLAGCGWMGSGSGGSTLPNGTAAPDFALNSLDGKQVRLSDYKGKIVVLNFWATWCPPCRTEIPDLVALQKEYKDKGVEIVGVSFDQSKDPVVQFVKDNGINYTVVMGTEKVDKDYGNITGIPTTYIIDREGTIRDGFVGARSKAGFAKAVKPLIGGE